MKQILAAVMFSVFAVLTAHSASGVDSRAAADAPATAERNRDWAAWTRPLGDDAKPSSPAPLAAPATAVEAAPAASEIDVVDAHWLALTIWGEARGGGEQGMRAVGHVIANRSRTQRSGAYVTDTVSEAWQFSAWNAGDPNREKMLNIDTLREGSADHRLWLAAKRIAAEILAGQSQDPTRGALFYHTDAVQPAWSLGVTPVATIGNHLFFRTAR